MKKTRKRVLCCDVGDVVICGGKKVWVAEVVHSGREDRRLAGGLIEKGERACVSACVIMEDNGQILKRSPRYIDDKWRHV